jgi:enoyl-CoA hydratase
MVDLKSFPPYLQIEVSNHVATITLTRPEFENRFNEFVGIDEHGALRRFMREAGDDPDIRVVILTGAGTEWFSAGSLPANLNSEEQHKVGSKDAEVLELVEHIHWDINWVREIIEYKKPLITALNGNVAAKPLTWAFLSDFCIAERHVKMRDMHVVNGIASSSPAYIWPKSTSLMKARKYMMTSQWFDAETADKMGLITEVVESGTSKARAADLARELAGFRPETLYLTKRYLNANLVADYNEIYVPAFISMISMLPRKSS